jgi:hypothetical protein
MEIVDTRRGLLGSKAKLIGRPVNASAANSATGKPHRKTPVVVVSPRTPFGYRGASELAPPKHQRILEHAEPFEVGQKCADGLVDLATVGP